MGKNIFFVVTKYQNQPILNNKRFVAHAENLKWLNANTRCVKYQLISYEIELCSQWFIMVLTSEPVFSTHDDKEACKVL